MKRKHMESHWKEMVAEQAARNKQNDDTAGRKAQGKTKAEKEGKAEADVKAKAKGTADDTLEDEEDFETEDGKSLWKSARDLSYRYRYPSLAVSLSILLICLLTAFGDSDNRPHRVPVSGRVVIDGEPLTSGTIIFVPEDGAHASIGMIDENGHFTLTCYDGNDGAVPGTHRMEVVLTRAPDEGAPPWPVPRKYANHQTSKLIAEITEPTENLLVELETDGEQLEGETGLDPSQLPQERE